LTKVACRLRAQSLPRNFYVSGLFNIFLPFSLRITIILSIFADKNNQVIIEAHFSGDYQKYTAVLAHADGMRPGSMSHFFVE
jgi:hypothetical protein